MEKNSGSLMRLELINTIFIALESRTAAFSVWRTNGLGSNAADESRQGLMDVIMSQAYENKNDRKAYQGTSFAYQYAVNQAAVEALESASSGCGSLSRGLA